MFFARTHLETYSMPPWEGSCCETQMTWFPLHEIFIFRYSKALLQEITLLTVFIFVLSGRLVDLTHPFHSTQELFLWFYTLILVWEDPSCDWSSINKELRLAYPGTWHSTADADTTSLQCGLYGD